MATRHHVPAGYTITASVAPDVTGFIRQARDPAIGSIVSSATPITYGPYIIDQDFIVTGDCAIAIEPNVSQGAIVPAIDPDNSAAANGAILAAAVTAAARVNGVVRLPSGRYPMACALTTGCIIEWAPDTVLLQDANGYVLDIDLSGDAAGPHTITAFSLAEHTNSAGASTNKFLRLTMAEVDASAYQRGDAIMVTSQDARTYYTGDTNYTGEMSTVHAVELNGATSYVYITPLRTYGVASLYSTTPVARRLSRKVVRLIRPQTEANGDVAVTGLTGSWPGAIQMKAVARPVFEDVRINSAWGIGLYLKSCALPRIRIDSINHCPGDPANNRFGYGILLRGACNGARIEGGYIEDTRHAFTTDCREASSWAIGNVWDHGDTTDTVVEGVTSIGNGAPPFDTHENSVGTIFRNCRAIGTRYNPSGITAANGYGFNLRGPWDAVIDCEAIGCEGGVNVAATGIIHEMLGDNLIDGFTYIGEATNNLAGYGISIDGVSGETTPQRVTIRNLRPAQGSRGIIVDADYVGHITIADSIFRGWIDTTIRVQGSCTLDIVNCLFDMTAAGTGELCISVDNSNTATIAIAHCWVRSKNATTPTYLITTASGATATIRHLNCGELTANGTALAGGAGTESLTAITAFT
jgi:hypothetical protein